MNIKEISEIVNFIISTELEQFKQDYELKPIPESQDIGSLSIAWLCYYCKENIDTTNREAITSFVDLVMRNDRYDIEGCSRISALQAASFALTGNETHLNDLLYHLSCYQSNDRTYITKSLAIICPIIPFNNYFFRYSVEENLKMNYGGDETVVILYLNSYGEFEDKIRWFKEINNFTANDSYRFLDDLIAGKSISEDFFKNTFNEIKSHILFRILKHSYLYNNQTDLFQERRIFPKTLDVFQDDHPLDEITFKFNIKEV